MKMLGLVYLAAILCLFGCSSGNTPSVGEAKRAIEERIEKQSGGLIKLISFEKTDGQEVEFLGIKGYRMSYAATIEFLEDCTWSGVENFKGRFYVNRGKNKRNKTIHEQLISPDAPEGSRGERVTVSGLLGFQKTETGWKPDP